MFDRDFWQEIAASFSSNKVRTGLTAAGVFWGIFMLILMMGIGKGMENGVTNEFNPKQNLFFSYSTYLSK